MKRRRRRGHRRSSYRRRNPGNPPGSIGSGLMAVLYGGGAAILGTLGGFALLKANLQNKWANAAAHAAAGVVTGTGMGMLSPAAGILVSHNFILNAANWAMSAEQATRSGPVQGIVTDDGYRQLQGIANDSDLGAVMAEELGEIYAQ